MQIILIRHGIRRDFEDPAWKLSAENPDDPPLAAAGLEQAEDIARALVGSGIGAIYSSPFLRALQTAGPSGGLLGVPVRIEPGFGEWLSPQFFPAPPRLLTPEVAAATCPQVELSYQPAHVPDGLEADETVEVRERVKSALTTIMLRAPGESFAVFTHGSPLVQAVGGLFGHLDDVDTRMGSITRIACDDGKFTLVSSNCDHLCQTDTHLRFH